MIKGLLALFRTGLIFNPMVLLGVICGIFLGIKVEEKKLFSLYANWHFYVLILLVAFIYNFIFCKRYNDGGNGFDYVKMWQNVLGSALMLLIANAGAISFVMMVSF